MCNLNIIQSIGEFLCTKQCVSRVINTNEKVKKICSVKVQNMTDGIEGRNDEEDDGCYVIRMDISEPLDTIKDILFDQVDGISDYGFTLQDSEKLDGKSNLLHYCVEGEGLVQVNVEIKNDAKGRRIDITDVLKPEDDDDDENVQSTDEQQVTDQQANLHFSDFNPTEKKKKRPSKRQTGAKESVKKMKLDQTGSASSQSTPVTSEPSANQLQLWQFLLELLVDYKCRDMICWFGKNGEFLLKEPERVAQLWGARRQKPNMTYESLSRLLRYYYAGDMITKVPGKKFVYKFTFDLEFLLGYSTEELNELVVDAETRSQTQGGTVNESSPRSISPKGSDSA
ncbi:GA-Hypothetical protein protein alpha chain [Nesidiocoris tenuis]|uniref:ETS domain-containing protein n=1 Tax=Nesidiocoris tenuis TaxID=355587 RepID=A0ABN7A527_9HEMI|nr:GA-Hypothetical protein protein alpha chain [Nesidiocoris tenuis]